MISKCIAYLDVRSICIFWREIKKERDVERHTKYLALGEKAKGPHSVKLSFLLSDIWNSTVDTRLIVHTSDAFPYE